MLWRLIALLFVSILISIATGCVSSQKEELVVTDFGVHALGNGMQLSVVDDNGLVFYSVSFGTAEPIIAAEQRASAYQKWMLLWDGSSLWFSSSDIGGVVWVKDENGAYHSTSFIDMDENLRDHIPSAISRFEKR